MGSVDVKHKKCEDCRLKIPNFGLPGEGKTPRWCSVCAKGHTGAVNIKHKKCEICQLKQASFGLPSEGKKERWCGKCAPTEALSKRLRRAMQASHGR
jgi:hypothetical protein